MPKRAARDSGRPASRSRPSKPSAKLIALIKAQRQKRAIGAKMYAAADELLQEIMQQVKPERKVPLGNGLFAVVHDVFADGGRAFKPVFMQRYELQIVDGDGKQTRMRDAAKKGRGKTTLRQTEMF